ncbi:hypothetical protein EDB85DRAFT_2154134 [Lactarius pseudohatsudake]|nr:hypothetical protein EDB85DRAFT_2154134 [Lactarius pseudohatsudake]
MEPTQYTQNGAPLPCGEEAAPHLTTENEPHAAMEAATSPMPPPAEPLGAPVPPAGQVRLTTYPGNIQIPRPQFDRYREAAPASPMSEDGRHFPFPPTSLRMVEDIDMRAPATTQSGTLTASLTPRPLGLPMPQERAGPFGPPHQPEGHTAQDVPCEPDDISEEQHENAVLAMRAVTEELNSVRLGYAQYFLREELGVMPDASLHIHAPSLKRVADAVAASLSVGPFADDPGDAWRCLTLGTWFRLACAVLAGVSRGVTRTRDIHRLGRFDLHPCLDYFSFHPSLQAPRTDIEALGMIASQLARALGSDPSQGQAQPNVMYQKLLSRALGAQEKLATAEAEKARPAIAKRARAQLLVDAHASLKRDMENDAKLKAELESNVRAELHAEVAERVNREADTLYEAKKQVVEAETANRLTAWRKECDRRLKGDELTDRLGKMGELINSETWQNDSLRKYLSELSSEVESKEAEMEKVAFNNAYKAQLERVEELARESALAQYEPLLKKIAEHEENLTASIEAEGYMALLQAATRAGYGLTAGGDLAQDPPVAKKQKVKAKSVTGKVAEATERGRTASRAAPRTVSKRTISGSRADSRAGSRAPTPTPGRSGRSPHREPASTVDCTMGDEGRSHPVAAPPPEAAQPRPVMVAELNLPMENGLRRVTSSAHNPSNQMVTEADPLPAPAPPPPPGPEVLPPELAAMGRFIQGLMNPIAETVAHLSSQQAEMSHKLDARISALEGNPKTAPPVPARPTQAQQQRQWAHPPPAPPPGPPPAPLTSPARAQAPAPVAPNPAPANPGAPSPADDNGFIAVQKRGWNRVAAGAIVTARAMNQHQQVADFTKKAAAAQGRTPSGNQKANTSTRTEVTVARNGGFEDQVAEGALRARPPQSIVLDIRSLLERQVQNPVKLLGGRWSTNVARTGNFVLVLAGDIPDNVIASFAPWLCAPFPGATLQPTDGWTWAQLRGVTTRDANSSIWDGDQILTELRCNPPFENAFMAAKPRWQGAPERIASDMSTVLIAYVDRTGEISNQADKEGIFMFGSAVKFVRAGDRPTLIQCGRCHLLGHNKSSPVCAGAGASTSGPAGTGGGWPSCRLPVLQPPSTAGPATAEEAAPPELPALARPRPAPRMVTTATDTARPGESATDRAAQRAREIQAQVAAAAQVQLTPAPAASSASLELAAAKETLRQLEEDDKRGSVMVPSNFGGFNHLWLVHANPAWLKQREVDRAHAQELVDRASWGAEPREGGWGETDMEAVNAIARSDPTFLATYQPTPANGITTHLTPPYV